ncbi:invasion associated locus B family protein [Brucella sp. 2716]|uniref:invasion associated locus B family protein n=1 Tax=Brucella sp. 2716 TaxID=2975052 RepID=UPI00217D2300|nr:invasion associated locus B family protein [Brucella sp. 2716]UWF59032.1 invasion associated locus B family protein [Brucella sp. 2716]
MIRSVLEHNPTAAKRGRSRLCFGKKSLERRSVSIRLKRALKRLVGPASAFLALAFSHGSVDAAMRKNKQPPAPPSIYTQTPGFAVKSTEIMVPDGVSAGEYRRITHPFPNWTLVCDENLKVKKRVCNITQTIMHEKGLVVFSWSLAAAENGKPYMIMRIPAVVGVRQEIRLDFGDGTPIIVSKTHGCEGAVCIAYLPVGPRLRGYIAKGSVPKVSYPVPDIRRGSADWLMFYAPLSGLANALAAI